MSDNRFSNCQEDASVLWAWRRAIMTVVSLEEQFKLESEALARIRELTPPAPRTVDEGALEGACEAAREYFDETSTDFLGDEDVLVLRIFDALGYQPALRTVTAEQRERVLDILNRCDWIASPKVLDEIIDALGITDPEPAPVSMSGNPSDPDRIRVRENEKWCAPCRAARGHSQARMRSELRRIAQEMESAEPAPVADAPVAARECTAWVNINGQHFWCDNRAGAHATGGHSSKPGGAIWYPLDPTAHPLAPVADAPHRCADVADDCCKRHRVDLAPNELLTLAKVVDDYERLYNDVAQVTAPDTMRTELDLDIIDAELSVRVVCNESGCWVLRIGGDQ